MEGQKNFILKHESLSDRWSYAVLGSDQALLFSVHGDPLRDMRELVVEMRRTPPPQVGSHPWLREVPTVSLSWQILTATGVPWGRIVSQYAPTRLAVQRATYTVMDSTSTPRLVVQADLKPLGSLAGSATFPDGRLMFTARGNLLGHNFSLLDPAGNEVARVHQKWLSVSDTYALDLVGNVEPFAPILFAILLDRAEQARRAGR